MPAADFIYLGDTARLPYGTKSADTVVRYSTQCAAALVARGIGCLVVACNTASASALDALRRLYPAMPVIGVIEPGAAAAGGGHPNPAYRRDRPPKARSMAAPTRQRFTHGCRHRSQFAGLRLVRGHGGGGLERGTDRGGRGAALSSNRCSRPAPCRHRIRWCSAVRISRCLAAAIAAVPAGRGAYRGLGADHRRRRRAASCARTFAAWMRPAWMRPRVAARTVATQLPRGRVTWLATDNAARFARIGGLFLGEPLQVEAIELVDL